jgi:hypothetical protein
MSKLIAVAAWWVSLIFTSMGFTGLLIKATVMGTVAKNFVALTYCCVVIVALLLNRASISLKAADVLELPSRLMPAATPLMCWVAFVQKKFRHEARLLLHL